MRVYYIGGRYESCYYVRCLLPLRANGWNGDMEKIGVGKSYDQMSKEVLDSDVVVFHRPIEQAHLDMLKALKGLGKKIVVDNDDTYKKDSGVPVQMLGRLRKELEEKIDIYDVTLKECLKLADLVTVTTEHLRKEYLEYNDNVVVLKNGISKLDWLFNPIKKSERIRIGIVGSVASNKDYDNIIPALDAIKDDDRFQLVLYALPPISDTTKLAVEMYKPEYKFWEKYKPEWHHFTPVADYPKKLHELNLDVILIPRQDNYFNRCKSNLKFLESSILGVPTIAQGFDTHDSPYQQVPTDSEHMVICTSAEEWKETILDIPDNREWYNQLGRKAKAYVLENYEINNIAHNWVKTYGKIN